MNLNEASFLKDVPKIASFYTSPSLSVLFTLKPTLYWLNYTNFGKSHVFTEKKKEEASSQTRAEAVKRSAEHASRDDNFRSRGYDGFVECLLLQTLHVIYT